MEFYYKVRAANGNVMRGSRSADRESEVVAWIRDKGWLPIEIQSAAALKTNPSAANAKAGINWEEFLDLSPKVKLKDKLVFFRQLSTMISAGVPIIGSLEILVQQTQNKRFKRVLKSILDRVSSGIPLGNALAEHPKTFDVLSTSLIRSGEESGTLDVSLNRLSGFLEAQENLRKKIISAFTYPAVVMCIIVIVLGVLCVVVVPLFQKSFGHLGVQMPWLTLRVFDLGEWAQKNWYYIPIAGVIIYLILHNLRKVPGMSLPLDKAKLKMPVFGGIIYKSSIARSFRTMASLLKSGVPVLQTLELAGDVANNELIKKNFYTMRDAASMGVPLNTIMKEKKLFPPMITHMVAVGEETGRTDEMLAKVADWYEAELEETIKRLSSIMEPVLVLIIGGVVAIMVFAIFLPIISAIQAFM